MRDSIILSTRPGISTHACTRRYISVVPLSVSARIYKPCDFIICVATLFFSLFSPVCKLRAPRELCEIYIGIMGARSDKSI